MHLGQGEHQTLEFRAFSVAWRLQSSKARLVVRYAQQRGWYPRLRRQRSLGALAGWIESRIRVTAWSLLVESSIAWSSPASSVGIGRYVATT